MKDIERLNAILHQDKISTADFFKARQLTQNILAHVANCIDPDEQAITADRIFNFKEGISYGERLTYQGAL